MDVFWLEQTLADVPPGEDWLSVEEVASLRDLRVLKRRADWRLGRWTAKNALAICWGYPTEEKALRDIEIRAATSGVPEVFFRNEPSTATISLSHRAGTGACSVALSHVLLGCDLEWIEPHSDGFAADYFTLEEQALVAKTNVADRFKLLSLLWSGKESALKALGAGLRLDTRSVIVSVQSMGGSQRDNEYSLTRSLSSSRSDNITWSPLEARSTNGQIFYGWWSQSGSLLRTVVSAPRSHPPVFLARECCPAF